MSIRRLAGSCSVVMLLFAVAGPAAASRSEVADAVMRGDTAAARALLLQKAEDRKSVV